MDIDTSGLEKRSGLNKTQVEMLLGARSGLVHALMGPGTEFAKTKKYREIEEVIAQIEKLLGY